MPWIPNRKICAKPSQRVESSHSNRWSRYYQSRGWKLLRHYIMSNNPLCYDCAMKGRSVPAEHCHHKIPFSWFDTDEDRMAALLDPSNCVPLCKDCHKERHRHLLKPDDFIFSDYYRKIHCQNQQMNIPKK